MISNMKNRAKKDQRRLGELMKLPIRLLVKAGDFYIQSITVCSGQFNCNAIMGCPSAQIPSALPRSLSASSTKSSTANKEDFRELVRAASARSATHLGNKVEVDLIAGKAHQPRLSPMAGPNAMLRSRSVGIGRIDEDKPCEFDEDEEIKVNKRDVYPRSRSSAVSRRSNMS